MAGAGGKVVAPEGGTELAVGGVVEDAGGEAAAVLQEVEELTREGDGRGGDGLVVDAAVGEDG